MIEITNKDLFGKTVADALAAVDGNGKINTFKKLRWVNAITKAVLLAEDRSDFIEYLTETDELVIWSDSFEVYSVNGSCQCEAANRDLPCKHLALKKLWKNYLENLRTAEAVPPPRASLETNAKCRKCGTRPVGNNQALCGFCEVSSAPYLKPTIYKKPERVGSIRI